MTNDRFGESAGRSRNNPVKPTARRRFSEAEREQRVHQWDDPNAWPSRPREKQWWERPTKRGWVVLGVAFFVFVVTVTVLTRDVCWTGDGFLGYGRCPWSP